MSQLAPALTLTLTLTLTLISTWIRISKINLPFITADASGPKHLEESLTRAEYARILDGALQAMTQPVCGVTLELFKTDRLPLNASCPAARVGGRWGILRNL